MVNECHLKELLTYASSTFAQWSILCPKSILNFKHHETFDSKQILTFCEIKEKGFQKTVKQLLAIKTLRQSFSIIYVAQFLVMAEMECKRLKVEGSSNTDICFIPTNATLEVINN